MLIGYLALARQTLSAPLDDTMDNLCTLELEAGINQLTPPEYLHNLATYLYWMNPHLEGEPLAKLLSYKGVKLQMISSSQVTFHQYQRLMDACRQYKRDLEVVVGDLRGHCVSKIDELKDTSSELFAEYSQSNPALIEKLAIDRGCSLIEARAQ